MVIYENKENCCGCGLCASICPKNAIVMKKDVYGYVYPSVDENLCVNCGMCVEACVFTKTPKTKLPIETYAAVRSDKEKIMNSSSGGVFAAVAEYFLKEGNYVCGARIEEDFSVKHVLINDVDDLLPLLGSKYVQSDINDVLATINNVLLNHKVLFCGTPCQVHAIKEKTNNTENLYTMELICHGVPNADMFQSYVEYIGNGGAQNFIFRDKKQGWSFNSLMIHNNGTYKKINHRLSSYMTFFMGGDLYRESCFKCPYACSTRGSDFTIGDYWGVVRKEPEITKKIHIDKGVSCLLVNTEKAKTILDKIDIELYLTEYSNIAEGNGPLNCPSKYTDRRVEVLRLWEENHMWKPLDDYWRQNCYKVSYSLWSVLPNELRQIVRLILRKR